MKNISNYKICLTKSALLLWAASLSENFQLIIKINRLGKQKTKVYPDEI